MIRAGFAAWGLLLAAETLAQVAGSVALVSDYRYRGITLSDGRPAAQASLGYDTESGWYAGGFASSASIADPGHPEAQAVAYAGFARRLRPDLSVDAGASYATFSRAGEYRYGEAYCGLAWDKLSAKIHYAPNYFGQGLRTVYAELNGMLSLRDRLRLIGHVGALRADHRGPAYPGSRMNRFDARLGAALELDWAGIELAWTATNAASAPYPAGNGRDKQAVVLSVSRAF